MKITFFFTPHISINAANSIGFILSDDLQDAHEFLAQCLDQLKEDCLAILPVSV